MTVSPPVSFYSGPFSTSWCVLHIEPLFLAKSNMHPDDQAILVTTVSLALLAILLCIFAQTRPSLYALSIGLISLIIAGLCGYLLLGARKDIFVDLPINTFLAISIVNIVMLLSFLSGIAALIVSVLASVISLIERISRRRKGTRV